VTPEPRRFASTLEAYGLTASGIDPVTGASYLRPPAWHRMLQDFQRWKRDAPSMLENAIAWRLEALQGDAFKGPHEDWPEQAAFIHAGLELALTVKYGDTVSGHAVRGWLEPMARGRPPRNAAGLSASTAMVCARPTESRRSCMPINAGLMSSATPEWETPKALFNALNAEFGPFELDVCATKANAKVPLFYSKVEDGLAKPWGTYRCWMNPPYGREIGRWVAKARQTGKAGGLVCCLLPARTDTRWWHDNIEGKATVVRFLKGRIRFSGAGPAPFPSCVVVFGNLAEPAGGEELP
jgi:phage N-6-adenine-methyltransferase